MMVMDLILVLGPSSPDVFGGVKGLGEDQGSLRRGTKEEGGEKMNEGRFNASMRRRRAYAEGYD